MEAQPLLATLRSSSLNSGIHNSAKWITIPWVFERPNHAYRKQTTTLKINTTCGNSLHDLFIHNGKHKFKSPTLAASQTSVEQLEQNSLMGSKTEENQKELSYLFRTKVGGLVKVSVGVTQAKYVVNVEFSSLCSTDHEMVLDWVKFRSDPSVSIAHGSKEFVTSSSQFTPEEERDIIGMPFNQKPLGGYIVKLEFDTNEAPFYLSFFFRTSADVAGSGSVIRTHRKTNFCVPVGIGRGSPVPLGVSSSNDGSVNFSIFSRKAESVILCLYCDTSKQPSLEIALDPYVNRTGNIWHVSVPCCQKYISYGYRFQGAILWDTGSRFHMRYVLLDPYAKLLGKFVPDQEGSISLTKCLGALDQEVFFDWGGDVHPQLPMEKLVVYRLNVGLFTEDISSQLSGNLAGTFSGLAEKMQHFKNLGVNAILLEPVFSFDQKKGPYYPYHFFSPMSIYGPDKDGVSAIGSFKTMVKALHAEGIEVLLEVVFAHTAEGGDAACQMITFRGIDNSSYYIVEGDIGSGAHNALNCNNPIVQRLILDSLQYWVTEFHVDGFSFVNASALLRGSDGYYLSHPPLLESIALDPLLSKTKIIADCWSPVDNSYKKVKFPHWKRWAEMNSQFCINVRNFLRGEGLLSDLATRLCGSGDIFSDSRGPSFSFNFVARNFGLLLVDLVSFGDSEFSSELSWNCGEGPTNNKIVLGLPLRQIRNFLFILFISLGVPVLNMGDECDLSTGGSSSYNERRPFNWTSLEIGFGAQIMQFVAFLSSLRTRRTDLLQAKNFLKVESIEWQGSDQSQPNWKDPSCKFLAMLLKAEEDEMVSPSSRGNLFVLFNGSDFPLCATLPQLSAEFNWSRLVDTALSFPGFFTSPDDPDIYTSAGLANYELQPHSCALFEARLLGN